MTKHWILLGLISAMVSAQASTGRNLLLNHEFQFSSFENSRTAKAESFRTGSVPFWNQDSYGDAEVYRSPRVPDFRPRIPSDGVVVIHPGKSIRQLVLLSEAQLDHGDTVSLSVYGHQSSPGALRAAIVQLQADNAPGEWSPKEFGQSDERVFPKHGRGELVRVELKTAKSGPGDDFELKIEKALVSGAAKEEPKQSSEQAMTLGLQIEFTNTSEKEVWIYSPCLIKGATAANRLPAARALPDYYRSIPRTIAKLRRGAPLHIITMGSSIDRGSANPPLYLYNEDPASPEFKQPISAADRLFDGELVGKPEWTPYFGRWQHYLSYTGRLRQGLMQRFDYPVDKLLLNFMACDGSSIGESHSALEEWATLATPPNPEHNGNKGGTTWEALYPALFARPEGARPDLVIFGSGANEKIDGPEEIAAFEGAIRWFQRHYPEIEFVFCMWQNKEGYTPNTGMLKELALHYGIPLIDFGREFDLVTRHANSYALTPKDGHPQAAAHFLWGHFLERAFQYVDPIASGLPQRYLPPRATPYTMGWEGELQSYSAGSPRIYKNKAFILDDTVVNVWASHEEKGKLASLLVDSQESTTPELMNGSRRVSFAERNPRNSSFVIGKLALGDQHIVEVAAGAKMTAVDSKLALNRRWQGVESKAWKLPLAPVPFSSEWGAPYGEAQVVLEKGQMARLEWVGTACSVAWLSAKEGGNFVVRVDGKERLRQAGNEPFQLSSGESVYMENRKGVMNLAFGVHSLEIEAIDGPVALLGAFSYDTRSNRAAERTQQGVAAPGETIAFSAPYKAPPMVICSGGLKVKEISERKVTFTGTESGFFQLIGE